MLDTLSGKLTQAYAAVDPRFGHMAVWTAHTVFGGAGSEVRWYEIDPAVTRIDQSGVVTDPNLQTFFFFGSLAPDRAVDGTSARFGSSMVLGFDQSSTTIDVHIAMVSKVGAKPQSAPVVVKTSPGPNVDAICFSSGRGAYGVAALRRFRRSNSRRSRAVEQRWRIYNRSRAECD